MESQVENLFRIAQERWLCPQEIEFMLSNAAVMNLEVRSTSHRDVKSGDVYFYRRDVKFKSDGVEWAKRKVDGKLLQETYNTIKINGVAEINGVYCKADKDPEFKRRIYRFINDRPGSDLAMVHYFNESVSKSNKWSGPQGNSFACSQDLQFQNPVNEVNLDDLDWMNFEIPIASSHEVFQSAVNLDTPPLLVQPPSEALGQRICQSLSTILDYAPSNTGNVHGGDKMIICLSQPLDISFSLFSSVQVYFVGIAHVPCVWLSPTVLRCYVPAKGQFCSASSGDSGAMAQCGLCLAQVTAQGLTALTPIACEQFQYSQQLGHLDYVNTPCLLPSLTDSCDSISCSDGEGEKGGGGNTLGKRVINSESLLRDLELSICSGNNTSAAESSNSSPHQDNTRVHKIRIVEKLGNMKNALHMDEPSMTPTFRAAAQSPNGCTSDGIWQEESLSLLSLSELQSLVDNYLTEVVQDLMDHHTTFDDDMRAQLDCPDESGFSLLHYCSLYSLTALVPPLLEKGVSINQHTVCGSTSLHLAASAGHFAVCEMLMIHGADGFALDAQGRTPAQCAELAGHDQIAAYIRDKVQDILSGISSPTVAESQQVSLDINTEHAQDGSKIASSFHLSPERPSSFSGGDVNAVPPSTADSSAILHDAFSSLTLSEKCAFSLSLSQMQQQQLSAPSVLPTQFPGVGTGSSLFGYGSGSTGASGSGSGGGGGGTEEFDVQSVLSETDRESLDVAMSMMGQSELRQVEEEVMKIQNNVRGWLLRKNYVNLREAAKTLQGAWRERKKFSHTHMPLGRRPSFGPGVTLGVASVLPTIPEHQSIECEMNVTFCSPAHSPSRDEDDSTRPRSSPTSCHSNHSMAMPSLSSSDSGIFTSFTAPPSSAIISNTISGGGAVTSHSTSWLSPVRSANSQRQVLAAETLQAVTRGMITRKSLERTRKKNNASLVIQKSLVQWWHHHGKDGHANSLSNSSPNDNDLGIPE